MTTTTGAVPRIRTYGDPSAGCLAGLDAALAMLVEARRIVRVGGDEPADIVHTIGPVTMPTGPAVPRVHTVDRIVLRNGRLVPAGWWLRREGRCAAGTSVLLAHGQMAGRLLVDAGLAPGERVHCLPLLAPLGCMRPGPGARRAVRDQLGVAPGVRLVLSADAANAGSRTAGWEHLLRCTGRRDVTVASICPAATAPAPYSVRLASGRWLSEPLDLAGLLAAADLFVAAGHTLEACNPATAAVACGVPVTAVTTDSVAELVLSAGAGFVVPARAVSVAQAVVAQLDSGLPLRRPSGSPPEHQLKVAELAHGLLMIYRRVLCASAVSGAA
jgi:hypothetical protein